MKLVQVRYGIYDNQSEDVTTLETISFHEERKKNNGKFL